MYSTSNTTCEPAYPGFVASWFLLSEIHRTSKIHSNVGKRWCFVHTKRVKGWSRWRVEWSSFHSSADHTAIYQHPNQTSPTNDPVLDRISVRVSLTPLCWTLWWALCTISLVTWCFLFRSIGCFAENSRSASCPRVICPPLVWNVPQLSSVLQVTP